MNTYLVLTVIGDDKPGLVESLANVVAAHQGNWLESSMSQLAGKFAGILRVSVARDNVDALTASLQELSSDLKIVTEEAHAAESEEAPDTVELSLMGNDRPGIVREISHALALLSVNVEQLNTECTAAPMSGAPLFKTRAILRVPAGLALEALQSELENLADDLMVEIKAED